MAASRASRHRHRHVDRRLQQTAVAVAGAIERAVDAVTDKAVLTTTVALVTEAVRQLAVTIVGIPNAVLESVSMLTAFLSGEGQFQIEQSLDAHVMAQIVSAAPPFGTTGATLVDKIRNGIASMRAIGASPCSIRPTQQVSICSLTQAATCSRSL